MKTAQTIAVFPDPPASMPAGLFADFEITGAKAAQCLRCQLWHSSNRGGFAVDHHPYHYGAGPHSEKVFRDLTGCAHSFQSFSSAATRCPDFCPAGHRSPPRRCLNRSSNEHSGSAHPARRTDGGCPRSAGAEASAPAQFAGHSSCDARRKARPYRLLWRSQRRTRATADQRDKSRSGTGIGRELWNPGYRYGPPVGKGRGYRSIWHAERRFWPGEQICEER